MNISNLWMRGAIIVFMLAAVLVISYASLRNEIAQVSNQSQPLSSVVTASPPLSQTGSQVAAGGSLDSIAQKYRIKILTNNPGFPVATMYGAITGKPPEKKHVDYYAAIFCKEFSRYPTELVKRSLLTRVIFCENLAFAGQLRTAIPSFYDNTLYLDVNRGVYDLSYVKKVIHHEYFHLIDFRDDGEVYSDKRWAALNDSKFSYGTGGKNAQHIADTSRLTTKYPGFLNHYSTTGVEEDKAELFANLIVDHKYVESRIVTDAVLKSKVERMKMLISNFAPGVTEDFWKQPD